MCGGQGVVHQATLVPDEVQDLEREQKVAVKKFHLDSETDYEKFLDVRATLHPAQDNRELTPFPIELCPRDHLHDSSIAS